MASSDFHKCSLCGKTLIERLYSGVWVFRFGEDLCIGGKINCRVVEVQLMGILRMRCTRRSCRRRNPDHWNEFNVFTINQSLDHPAVDICSNTITKVQEV